MSTLRTFNLQNPDSGTVNIEMDQGGNTLMTGIATVRGAAHFTSTSGSDAVGIGTDITAYKLDVRVTGAEAGLRVYNPDTSSNASGILRLGNDDNQNAAFLRLNGSNNTSAVGGAGSLVLGHGLSKDLHLSTAGVSRLSIASDGIATFNAENININRNAGDPYIALQTSGTTNATLYGGASTGFRVFTKPSGGSLTERLRIASDGQIFIGGGSDNSNSFSDAGTFFNLKNDTYGGRIGFSNNTATAGVALMEQFAYWGNNKISGIVATAGSDTSNKDDGDLRFYTRKSGSAVTERLRIDSTGSIYAGGSIITNADMNWGHDTYQRPHIFTGVTGGNPSDGCLVLASPETNPGGTRIGSIVFGCKTSSASGVSNSGIKATIECNTNNNLSDAWKTGASITFKTRPNNGNPTAAQTIHHNGNITKPLQPAFRALSTGFSKNNNWQKITFGTENYDIGGYYDHGNNKFTAPVAGRYVFYAGGWSSSTSTDSRYAFCARVNGGGLHYLAGAHYGNVDSPMAGYSVIHNLAANDYVELWGYSAVATTWGGGSHYMFWGGYLLG